MGQEYPVWDNGEVIDQYNMGQGVQCKGAARMFENWLEHRKYGRWTLDTAGVGIAIKVSGIGNLSLIVALSVCGT